jgi:hypothetical protein
MYVLTAFSNVPKFSTSHKGQSDPCPCFMDSFLDNDNPYKEWKSRSDFSQRLEGS